MATPVIMPRQGQSVETCIITTWLKKKGEQVTAGDLIFSYETDKASFDMEAPADGILLDIFYDEGDEVPVLTNVAVIGAAGEKSESFRPSGQVKKEKTEPLPPEKGRTEKMDSAKGYQNDPGGKIKISPRARLLAQEKGADINLVKGTGPEGRIIVKDIENALSAIGLQASGDMQPVTGDRQPGTGYTDQPLTNVRKLISKAMHASLQNSAQLTHHMSADVRKLLDARRKIKGKTAKGILNQDITINDMVCWCVIRALKKFPEMNSHFLDDRIRTFRNVHLGLAVDTPRGLMVAAVRNADSMDLHALSKEMKAVAEACRKGNIDPELLQSTAATFTVSNLGNYGVEMFTPVINLPQSGILGVCTIINRPADLGNNLFGFVPVMGLSLTYDHRAIDGGPATVFLKEIKEQIERFEYKI
jgi:pyruvate dehydrogenase E2 component (dihydrolipoamide acetyltransferase)